jgi:hypothetical protein
MNRKYLVPCFVTLFLLPIAGVTMSSASEGASASPTAASSADWSDANSVSLPAGVGAEWWAQTQTAIHQLQDPNPDVVAPLRPRASWKAEGNQHGAHFGNSVDTAGDVNGDGYDDVIVGSYQYDNGQRNEGRAFVSYGSASGLSLTPDWTAESDQIGAWFGFSVGTAGDVNGDGYDDVIVGAISTGHAYVYYGSASGLSLTPDWTAESNQALAYFGSSVGTAGDVNGDGYADVIVGSY